MKEILRVLGKVRPTIEGEWNIQKEYRIISIVNDGSSKSYISKQDVPKGILLTNKEYWEPIANNIINGDTISLLSSKDKTGNIQSFDLEEAINTVNEADRRPGLFISFYEKPTSVTENYRWNLYQFNSSDVNNWTDVAYWNSIYYNETKFFGWQEDEDNLYRIRKNPKIGDYAFVGKYIKDTYIYRCRNNNVWSNTYERANDFLSVIVNGNVSIGNNGNWFINGVDIGIKAEGPKGDKGEQGIQGPPNNIKMGNVELVENSYEAFAEIIGEYPNQTLNLKIPRGFKGDSGATLGNVVVVQDFSTDSGSENKVISQKGITQKLYSLSQIVKQTDEVTI